MRTNRKQTFFALIAMIALTGIGAHAQTDISLSGFGTFNNPTTGNGTVQSSPNSYGGMIGVRHTFSPLVGLEADYSLSESDQSLSPEIGACGFRCNNTPITLSSKASEISINYVASAKFGSLRPFALVGLGFVITVPSGSVLSVNTGSRPAYIAGGGADWAVSKRIGVRVQYRVNFYKAPDVYNYYSPTGGYVHTQEPMGGVFFRF